MLEITSQLDQLFGDISEIAGYLWQKGWAERNGGNISVNVSHFMPSKIERLHEYPFIQLPVSYPQLDGKSFWITATGSRIRNLQNRLSQNSGIIHISTNPNGYFLLWPLNYSFEPTSELASHLKIHQFLMKNSLQEKVILHTHPDELIALTHINEYCQEDTLNRILWGMMPEIKIFVPHGVGVVPYQLPGTEELAVATIKGLQNHKVVLWEKHGCLAIGRNVIDAFDTIDILNKGAKIFLLCQNARYTLNLRNSYQKK